MPKLTASLSLDLDNKWSYIKTHGDAPGEGFPSYLDDVVPRFLQVLHDLDLRITVFVVGQDAALEKNRAVLGAIARAGHEIGNHSFSHVPALHLYSAAETAEEVAKAETSIELATGCRPVGFRGPGFSHAEITIQVLIDRGYEYDGSTFPTFFGPLARLYDCLTAESNSRGKTARTQRFGRFRDGFKPLHPYVWSAGQDGLVEIPVTTMPLFRLPIHVSYLLYLRQYSRALAMAYFSQALRLCRLFSLGPSLLLHSLDFWGGDQEPDLAFLPAMNLRTDDKVAFVTEILAAYKNQFHVVTMREHARILRGRLTARSTRPVTPHVASETT